MIPMVFFELILYVDTNIGLTTKILVIYLKIIGEEIEKDHNLCRWNLE
jgi:hypothetical protein